MCIQCTYDLQPLSTLDTKIWQHGVDKLEEFVIHQLYQGFRNQVHLRNFTE